MKYGSVCSGIEAATAAWHPLGWQASFFSEIEKFPCSVLKHHYPDTPLHGDFTTIQGKEYEPIDLLVGGTPCQDFSVAGLRKGLTGERGNLTLSFIRLVERLEPRWVVWENVPGVLSIDGGRAFGAFLGGLGECGYGFAYRILDAQYFGVPQRRRRVFVIGHLGDWRPAAAVLFERESLQRDITPSREAGQSIAGTFESRSASGGWSNSADHAAAGYMIPATAYALQERDSKGTDSDTKEGHLIPVAFAQNTRDEVRLIGGDGQTVGSLAAETGMKQQSYVAFAQNQLGEVRTGEVFNTINQNSNASGRNTPLLASPITAGYAKGSAVNDTQKGGPQNLIPGAMQVRRLTPVECERLQGFPDNYTKISAKTADGPRYKALGNSMAVPVMRWLGERINMIEGMKNANS